ncbi:helix-turn-helix transcriptional regulator [Micromonospora sp. NPDC047812]|uniref:helix-turn-helix domain-containing protein n=1 Tax=Micromonospora sp. NPDC047812 TaxID=3155742 RepID=UPI0034513B5F
MFPDPTDAHAGAFAAVFVALYVAHQVADHWVQTQHQATHKGCDPEHGRAGHPHCSVWRSRWHCAAHVATYTLTAAVALLFLMAGTGLRLDPWAVTVGLTVSAVSHYVADRRVPLRRLADALGKDPAWLERGGGLYALDQSWHIGFLFVAALLAAA